LDAGEDVTLNVEIKNIGHSDAPLTLAGMTTLSNIATLNTTSFNLNTVGLNNWVTAHFDMTVSSSAQIGDPVELNFTVGTGAYNASAIFIPTVGLIAEDFETGDLTHMPWQVSGPAPWFVTNQDPYEGLYCLKSGVISDQQSTTLSLNAEVLVEDSISFFRKVSSEADYDYLQFFIDTDKLDEWAGTVAWGRVAFLAGLGQHNFKWVYDKDYSYSSGGDCAWVDFIVFPSVAGITTGTPESDNILTSFSILPNPSTDQTKFVFYIEKTQKIDLKVYDATGREISVLLNHKNLGSGQHTYYFDTASLGKGVYFCHFTSGSYQTVKKLVVE
jgi:hypothetical protein